MSGWGELDSEAEVFEPPNEAAGRGRLLSFVEVIGAEILVEGSVL